MNIFPLGVAKNIGNHHINHWLWELSESAKQVFWGKSDNVPLKSTQQQAGSHEFQEGGKEDKMGAEWSGPWNCQTYADLLVNAANRKEKWVKFTVVI